MLMVAYPWDTGQIHPECEWHLWHQLWGVWGVDMFHTSPVIPAYAQNSNITQHATFEEAVAACTGQRIFLDANSPNTMVDLPANLTDTSIIVGNTPISTVGMEQPGDLTCRVITPGAGDMYGVNAAAIVLAWQSNRSIIGV